MKLNFLENKERDINNWQESVRKQSHGVDWIRFLPRDIKLECVEDFNCLNSYLENRFYSTGKIKDFIVKLSEKVNTDQIQQDLEEILQCKFKVDDYRIFVTTFHRAPFHLKEHYFFVIFKEDISKTIASIYHELMHFLFYQNWYDFCKENGLDDNQINTFKEALTILLNDILEKRSCPLDSGYSSHKELRNKILEIKKNSVDIKDFFKKAVEIMK